MRDRMVILKFMEVQLEIMSVEEENSSKGYLL